MKANPFDQFDGVRPQAAAVNPFDQFDAPEAPPVEVSVPDVGMGESFARGAGQGVTFGLSDEVQAGVAAGGLKLAGMLGLAPDEFADRSLSDIYSEAKGTARGFEKAAEQANPGTYLAGDVVGSLAVPVPGGSARTVAGLAKQGVALGAGNAFGRSEGETIEDIAGDVTQGAATGALLNTAVGKGIQAGGNAIRKLAGVNADKLATFQEAGIAPMLSDVTDSGVAKSFQNLVGETPFSAGIIDKGKERTLKDANKILDAAGLNVARSQQGAGETIRSGLERYKERGQKVVGKLYDRLDKYIPSDLSVNTSPIQDTISKLRGEASTPGLKEALKESRAGKLMSAIQNDIKKLDPNGMDYLARYGSTSTDGSLPYEAVKKYRTIIGREMKDRHLLRSEDEAIYDRLYAGLSEAMKDAATGQGARAITAFEKANAVNSLWKRKMDEQISPLLKRSDTQELFNKVLTNQKLGKKSQAVMNTLDSGEKQIVRGSLIKQLGENNINEFDPIRAATRIAGLEPEARQALTSGMSKGQSKQFDKAIDALLLAKETAAKGNPSRSLYGSIGSVAAVGAYADLASTGAILAGANISARLMQNQKFINWLAGAPSGLGKNASKYIGRLSGMAAGDPDVQDFVDSVTGSSDANAAEAPMEMQAAPPAPAQESQLIVPQSAPEAPPVSNYLQRLAQIESGGNPNAKAKTSSASGLYQFTNSTWKDMVGKYGKEYGVSLKDKNDPQKSGIMAELLAKENANGLQKTIGREPNEGELYIAHFLGQNGAAKLINSYGSQKKAAALFPEAARANKSIFFAGDRPRTVEEVYKLLHDKMAA